MCSTYPSNHGINFTHHPASRLHLPDTTTTRNIPALAVSDLHDIHPALYQLLVRDDERPYPAAAPSSLASDWLFPDTAVGDDDVSALGLEDEVPVRVAGMPGSPMGRSERRVAMAVLNGVV